MLTFDEMKARVGRKLGILADTMTLSAEDGQIIGDALNDVDEQVIVLIGTPILDSERNTETRYAEHFAVVTAAQLVDEYGIPEPRRSQLISMGRIGLIPPPPAVRALRDLLNAPLLKLNTTTDVNVV